MALDEILLWTLLFLPLLAAAIITLFTSRRRRLSAGISIAAVVLSFLLALVVFAGFQADQPREYALNWLSLGDFAVQFGIRLDSLSMLMLLVVTGVAAVIHVYSWGYLAGDPGFSRFFTGLSLFTFSMLGIVAANNFIQLFICWELVGCSSYLLIGFWYDRPAAADAGLKAFVTTRIGDFGFLLGILTVWAALGSLNFAALQERALAQPGLITTAAGLLIFCGAAGKSAQFPLHVWLPDAMEGPTPVSALIHAATMVAAGVYMLCRVLFLLNAPALQVIAWVGAFTALLTAIIATQQNDIKRILAYSTLSQLGYMVLAVGLGGATPAMFHLTTHAFFKALLFLGAGSVILALHHEQDIWKMGGLRQKLPVTFWTFLAGTLALAGVWPLSGFFSKDSILALAAERNHALLALALLTALLTSFYMFRLVLVVFFTNHRSAAAGRAVETPPVMVIPLRLLAIPTVAAGFLGIEYFVARQFEPQAAARLSAWGQLVFPFQHAPLAALSGLAAAGLGFLAAYQLYAGAKKEPLESRLGAFGRAVQNRFYFDELYAATVIRAHEFLARAADWMDRWLIAGLGVRGTHGTTELLGRALRLFQTGNVQTYAFLFALGLAVVLWLALR